MIIISALSSALRKRGRASSRVDFGTSFKELAVLSDKIGRAARTAAVA